MPLFDLRLATGQVVTRNGKDGIDAAHNYVADHRDATVIAWRWHDRHGIYPAPARRLASFIIEPGHRAWGKR